MTACAKAQALAAHGHRVKALAEHAPAGTPGERQAGLEPANSAGSLAFASGHSYLPPAAPDSTTAPGALTAQPSNQPHKPMPVLSDVGEALK